MLATDMRAGMLMTGGCPALACGIAARRLRLYPDPDPRQDRQAWDKRTLTRAGRPCGLFLRG